MLGLSPRRHPHLRLAAQIRSGDRIRRKQAMPPQVRHPDQRAHGRTLIDQVVRLRAMHAARVPVLGVNPELVVVLETNRAPAEDALRTANLYVLDWFDDRVVVAALTDPELTAFMSRLEQYQQGPRRSSPDGSDAPTRKVPDTSPNTGRPVPADPADSVLEPSTATTAEGPPRSAPTAPYQSLLDCIDTVRGLGPAEILTPRLVDLLATTGPSTPLLVDVHCWCPEDEDDARSWQDATAEAVEAGGGRVLDRVLRHRAGLSVLRVELSPAHVRDLAEVYYVRLLDELPRSTLSHIDVVQAPISRLPMVTAPPDNAPTIAVIDGGIRSGHPLLGPAVADLLAVAGLDESGTGNGHGTFVASLALHGSLELLLDAGRPLEPAARLVSVRVLDDNGLFPDLLLWESHLLEALELAVQAGARIINLSIGDPRHPYRPSRPTPLAAALDLFAREHNVVLVVSVGNYPVNGYPAAAGGLLDHAQILLADVAAGMLDPATAALALTVGALCADDGQGHRPHREDADLVPVGGMDLPSPVTRRGPGVAHMVKPELSMPGGAAALHTTSGRLIESPAHNVLGADGTRPSRLLTTGVGTSFAAPLVTHIAARVLGRDPTLSANAVRALVLSSATPLGIFTGPPSAAVRTKTEQLVGYGRPDAARAESSTDHRAVLLAEGQVPVNGVHLYRVPVPASFFDSGGWRQETVALAYDPPVRSTRLDYLASRMHVTVYTGLTVDQVASAYVAEAATTAPAADDADDLATAGPAALARHRLDLHPSDADRSRGTHHFGTHRRSTARARGVGDSYVIAVQNINKWDAPGALQAYALAFVLERDDRHDPIYAELQAFVETQAVAQIEPYQVVEVQLYEP